MMFSRVLRSMLAAALTVVAAGCGSTSGGMGTLAIELVDAPSPDVKGIVVTIDSVTVHSEQSGWVTVAHGPITVDLLTLQNVGMELGEVSLPAGTVTQIRLILADGPQYVVLADGSHDDLKTPSGQESGLKLVGQFTVSACNKHTITLDFDGKNSIEYHDTPSPNGWILRPVIRVKAEADEPASCHPDGGAPGGLPSSPDGGSNGGSDAGPSGDTDAGTPPVIN